MKIYMQLKTGLWTDAVRMAQSQLCIPWNIVNKETYTQLNLVQNGIIAALFSEIKEQTKRR